MQALTQSDPALPEIHDKLYCTIGEVGELCDLKPHVLRYWEQGFSQLKPVKRRGNRRYYPREDVLLVRQIRTLLYDQGFTIEGARQQLSGDTKPLGLGSGQLIEDGITDLEQLQELLQS